MSSYGELVVESPSYLQPLYSDMCDCPSCRRESPKRTVELIHQALDLYPLTVVREVYRSMEPSGYSNVRISLAFAPHHSPCIIQALNMTYANHLGRPLNARSDTPGVGTLKDDYRSLTGSSGDNSAPMRLMVSIWDSVSRRHMPRIFEDYLATKKQETRSAPTIMYDISEPPVTITAVGGATEMFVESSLEKVKAYG